MECGGGSTGSGILRGCAYHLLGQGIHPLLYFLPDQTEKSLAAVTMHSSPPQRPLLCFLPHQAEKSLAAWTAGQRNAGGQFKGAQLNDLTSNYLSGYAAPGQQNTVMRAPLPPKPKSLRACLDGPEESVLSSLGPDAMAYLASLQGGPEEEDASDGAEGDEGPACPGPASPSVGPRDSHRYSHESHRASAEPVEAAPRARRGGSVDIPSGGGSPVMGRRQQSSLGAASSGPDRGSFLASFLRGGAGAFGQVQGGLQRMAVARSSTDPLLAAEQLPPLATSPPVREANQEGRTSPGPPGIAGGRVRRASALMMDSGATANAAFPDPRGGAGRARRASAVVYSGEAANSFTAALLERKSEQPRGSQPTRNRRASVDYSHLMMQQGLEDESGGAYGGDEGGMMPPGLRQGVSNQLGSLPSLMPRNASGRHQQSEAVRPSAPVATLNSGCALPSIKQ